MTTQHDGIPRPIFFDVRDDVFSFVAPCRTTTSVVRLGEDAKNADSTISGCQKSFSQALLSDPWCFRLGHSRKLHFQVGYLVL